MRRHDYIHGMTRKGLLLFAAMCIIWGIPYLLSRVAVGEISPGMLVFARTAIGALILLPIAVARGGLRGIGRKLIPILATRRRAHRGSRTGASLPTQGLR